MDITQQDEPLMIAMDLIQAFTCDPTPVSFYRKYSDIVDLSGLHGGFALFDRGERYELRLAGLPRQWYIPKIALDEACRRMDVPLHVLMERSL